MSVLDSFKGISYVSTMMSLRSCGSKKVPKKGQRHPIQIYRGQYCSLGVSRKKQRGKTKGTNELVGTTVGPWWAPRSMVALVPRVYQISLWLFVFQVFGIANLILAIKASFYYFHSSIPFHSTIIHHLLGFRFILE